MSNFCTNCGSQLGTGKFCQNCGAKVEEVGQKAQAWAENTVEEKQSVVTQVENKEEKVAKEKTREEIKEEKRKKFHRNGVIVALVFIGIAFLGIIYPAISQGQQAAQRNGPSQPGTIVEKLEKAMGVTTARAKEIADILEKCGIKTDTILRVEHEVDKDNLTKKNEKLYRLKNADSYYAPGDGGIWMYSDGEIYTINWLGNNLYENGKVIAKVSDFILTDSEKNGLKAVCQEAILKALAYPDTAKFASIDDWEFTKSKEEIVIWAYVDAKDMDGVTKRKPFTFVISSDKNKLISITFEGKTYKE